MKRKYLLYKAQEWGGAYKIFCRIYYSHENEPNRLNFCMCPEENGWWQNKSLWGRGGVVKSWRVAQIECLVDVNTFIWCFEVSECSFLTTKSTYKQGISRKALYKHLDNVYLRPRPKKSRTGWQKFKIHHWLKHISSIKTSSICYGFR